MKNNNNVNICFCTGAASTIVNLSSYLTHITFWEVTLLTCNWLHGAHGIRNSIFLHLLLEFYFKAPVSDKIQQNVQGNSQHSYSVEHCIKTLQDVYKYFALQECKVSHRARICQYIVALVDIDSRSKDFKINHS